jgi:predicted nucleic acid-binding protein
VIFTAIPAGASIFLDANTLVFHFASHPTFRLACEQLLDRVARRELIGFSSAHVLTNVAHRLMTIEAMSRFGWPEAGIVRRLQKHRTETRNLDLHRQAVDAIAAFGVQIIPNTQQLVRAAAIISQQHELLSGDALIVASMQTNGLTNLASHDADFDGIPGITRYGPM